MLSRIGRRPIPIPEGVKVTLTEEEIIIEGPKGRLSRPLHPLVEIVVEEGQIKVNPRQIRKRLRRKAGAFQGLYRALINNMVIGVTKGFQRILDIVGLGYRAEIKGNTLVLNVGYSHPVEFSLPEGISAKVDKGTGDVQARIVLEGIDKERVGLTAAKIRAIRPPEPYKGKGIRYSDEVIVRKAGKAGK
ncbi:50S ribosomal protein L6 [Thermosulfuriphilus sp.]